MRWPRRAAGPGRSDAAAQAADVERIAGGGIPAAAERRLRGLANRPGAFTSDLSVAEFALLRDVGLEPVAQVSGSCVYALGWGYATTPGWTVAQELRSVSDAYTEARTRAIRRLHIEAELAQADGVVGVHVKTTGFEWGSRLIEVALIGTAVRGPRLRTSAGPALTTLSGQDCALLLRHGHRPQGIVGGTGVFSGILRAPGQAPSVLGPLRLNYEYEGATRTWYAARHSALGRLRAEAEALRADGVVGTRWSQEERFAEQQRAVTFTIHALGTAIAVGTAPPPTVASTLSLKPKEAPTP